MTALKNAGSMVQTCRKINVHVVNTDIYVEIYMNVHQAKVISALQHKSKYKLKFNSNIFEKNRIFRFPRCSTREDLTIDVFITTVGLIGLLTKRG